VYNQTILALVCSPCARPSGLTRSCWPVSVAAISSVPGKHGLENPDAAQGHADDRNESPAPGFESRFCGVEFLMRTSGWTPSIVPRGDDQTVNLVMDDLGRNRRVGREADEETIDLKTVIQDLLTG
jgi:hypothetical protein